MSGCPPMTSDDLPARVGVALIALGFALPWAASRFDPSITTTCRFLARRRALVAAGGILGVHLALTARSERR